MKLSLSDFERRNFLVLTFAGIINAIGVFTDEGGMARKAISGGGGIYTEAAPRNLPT